MPPGGAPPMPGGPPGASPMAGAARANIGPATAPQAHGGTAAAAMNDLQNAIKMLEKALPSIPMGTPIHAAVLKAATDLSKHLGAGSGNEGLQLQSLLQMARQAQQNAPMAALSRIMPGPDGSPPAPIAPPGGGGGAPPMPMAA